MQAAILVARLFGRIVVLAEVSAVPRAWAGVDVRAPVGAPGLADPEALVLVRLDAPAALPERLALAEARGSGHPGADEVELAWLHAELSAVSVVEHDRHGAGGVKARSMRSLLRRDGGEEVREIALHVERQAHPEPVHGDEPPRDRLLTARDGVDRCRAEDHAHRLHGETTLALRIRSRAPS